MHPNTTVRGFRCNLYVASSVKQFGSTGSNTPLASLEEYLRKTDSDTSLRYIRDIGEIQLTIDGKTVSDGYRFTVQAFRQAAQIMGPGISKFLPDLAGMTGSIEEVRSLLVDGHSAIRFWNELADLRFPLFERYRIIRNEQERTIEGFVSHKHQYLENLWLYREAVETLTRQVQNVSVYAASLAGRRFSLWFRRNDPVFSINVDGQFWPCYGGYYFTNGEATGTSVRGTIAVFTPKGVCLGAYRKFGKRITHVGRDFMERIGGMFESVVHNDVPWDKLEAGANAMLTKSLGYKADWRDDQRKERSKKISHSLGILGVQRNLAAEVTSLALSVGRYHGLDAVEWSQASQLYTGRTVLDLFVPLLGLARRIDAARREKLEQVAFDILMGRLLL